MANTILPNTGMTAPENGADSSAWGTHLNGDLAIIDGIFAPDGSGTGVGMQIGSGKTLKAVAGSFLSFCASSLNIYDASDPTKIGQLDTSTISTGNTRVLQYPDSSGVIATQAYVIARTPTGTILDGYYGNTAPAGYLFLNGTTFGSASSGGSQRANADTLILYTLLWNLGLTPTGGRGATAAADFAANKPMATPDHRGCVRATLDTNGGITSAARLIAALASTTRFATGGQATESAGVSVSVSGGVSVGVGVTVSGVLNGSASGVIGGGEFDADGQRNGGTMLGTGITLAASVSGALGGSGSGSGSFSGSGGGSTSAVTNAQPSIMVDTIIAL